jgi:predicted unusual protein kinase regulating ubiquinone biosynthesis (AarF/ABC1/UbiB family)
MMTKAVPTGKFTRSRVAGGALLKASGKQLSHLARRPFMSQQARSLNKEKLDENTAQILFDTFSQLRGTALKLAQMLSMDSHLLPEPIRKELSKSCHQAVPLGRPLIRKMFLQEFGKPAEAIFSEFNHCAFAAASLGQVHHARTDGDKPLAVKLQYPGIDVTIDNDLQMMRSLIKRTSQAKLLLSSLDEIGHHLHKEVDYQQEADHTDWFREHLQLPDIVIPTVHREYSTKRIITTNLLSGVHLEQWLSQSPNQQRRDHFAQRLYELFVNSFYGLHVLHADPNPGNYLFADDGTLGLLDFGCVRHFSAEFVTLTPHLLNAYMQNDAESIIQIYRKLGIVVTELSDTDLQTFYHDLIEPFGDWLTKPFKAGTFDFGSRASPYTKQGWATFKQLSRVTKIDGIANEFIYFDRTLFGLYQIFERLEAKVNMEHPWLI